MATSTASPTEGTAANSSDAKAVGGVNTRKIRLREGDGENDVAVHVWNEDAITNDDVDALCVVYHGFLAHGLYPTVRYGAEMLANDKNKRNIVVVAADMQGHGQSDGLPGYLPSSSEVIEDGRLILKYALDLCKKGTTKSSPKIFLMGSSMGGAIALSVAHKVASFGDDDDDMKDVNVDGVILLAPMLQLDVGATSRFLLSCASNIPYVGKLEVIPSSSADSSKQYRDEGKRKEIEEDPYRNTSGCIRVASAKTCVEMASEIRALFPKVSVPFFLAVADEDVVVNNQGSLDLYEQCSTPSKDKTMKRYPALHGLLCEPSPLLETIQSDMLQWLNDRC